MGKGMNDNLQIDDGNFTRVHNRILEELAKVQLSGHETRIVFALWRKTYGWQKKEDFISVSQFQEITGLNKVRISETIRKLKRKNLVTENRNSNGVVYGFNKRFTTWRKLQKTVTVTENRKSSYGKTEELLRKTVTENRRDSSKNGHHETPKETITKEKEIYMSGESPDDSPILNLEKKKSYLSEIKEIFSYWQEIFYHPQAKLSNDRRAKIKARFAEGYTVDQLKKAIDGCKASAYHMGENESGKKYDSIGLIFRNADKVEQFWGYVEEKKNKKAGRPL